MAVFCGGNILKASEFKQIDKNHESGILVLFFDKELVSYDH